MKTFWKLRMVIIIAALVLVAGGAIVVGAHGLGIGSNEPKSNVGSAQQDGGQANTEPTKGPQAPEATKTKGPEPAATPASVIWSGKIVSVDCAGGTITIMPDNATGTTASATMANTVGFTVSGQTSSCAGLKVGWHVMLEVKQINGQWIVYHIVQDDSGQGGGSGGGDASPTPGSGH